MTQNCVCYQILEENVPTKVVLCVGFELRLIRASRSLPLIRNSCPSSASIAMLVVEVQLDIVIVWRRILYFVTKTNRCVFSNVSIVADVGKQISLSIEKLVPWVQSSVEIVLVVK